jgi:hypothetical protein
MQIVHYMFYFHYQTTFHVLPSLMILTHSSTQDKINFYKHNRQVYGQFMLEVFQNTDHILQYSASCTYL